MSRAGSESVRAGPQEYSEKISELGSGRARWNRRANLTKLEVDKVDGVRTGRET